MANQMFRQCRMSKEGREDIVAFLPEKFCQKKLVVSLMNKNGEWDENWTVEHCSEKVIPQNQLPEEHRHWRKCTDI